MIHDPLLESLTGEGVDNVADVLPWHLLALLVDRQRVDNLLKGGSVVPYELDGEAFKLRHVEVLDIVAMDSL